jgi:hypothetical protein
MELLRTKRIRIGVIVIVVSVIVLAVVGALHYHRTPANSGYSWLDDTVIRWQTGQVATKDFWGRPLTEPTYGYLKVKHTIALGLVAVGVGAVLMIVGLTTPRELKAEDKSKGGTNG